VQADCPARFELRRDGDAVLREHLSDLDVFLPSSSDTDVFAAGIPHRDLVRRFHDDGAPVVILKRGESGAYVSDARTGEAWNVPALPMDEHLDATGAGDVFCGTFAHSYTTGASLLDAAIQATVAAGCALHVDNPLALARPGDEQWHDWTIRITEGVTPL
jgi:sugar/nucleoside kinase (ribokinase family)